MPLKKPRKSGSSIVGDFPSIKLNEVLRCGSRGEKDFFYFMEFFKSVTWYKAQPFTTRMTLDNGEIHSYTPDVLARRDDDLVIVEIKRASRLGDKHTRQQREIGERLASQNEITLFLMITEIEMREGPKLDNLKLLYGYGRLRIYPFNFFEGIQELFSNVNGLVPFQKVAEFLMPADPARCKPYLWSLIFHHYLQYLRQLGGRNWFKSGMNHAQTGNLLENLSQ